MADAFDQCRAPFARDFSLFYSEETGLLLVGLCGWVVQMGVGAAKESRGRVMQIIVRLDVMLARICGVLECQPGDLLEADNGIRGVQTCAPLIESR